MVLQVKSRLSTQGTLDDNWAMSTFPSVKIRSTYQLKIQRKPSAAPSQVFGPQLGRSDLRAFGVE
jgi:hypothetical protein